MSDNVNVLFILLAALWLLCAPNVQAHGNREEGCRRCGQGSRSWNQDGDRQWGRHDGNHSGRYRPFYSYPLRDCPDEPQLYNRRTGRMEPSCEVPCVHDRMNDKDWDMNPVPNPKRERSQE